MNIEGTRQLDLSENEEEKIPELLNVVKEKFDSFTNSDDAYETAEAINGLHDYLKNQDLNPKDYYLWSLLAPDSQDAIYSSFDTPDGDIENFIRDLKHS